MAVYKRGGTYWYKFRFNGELIRESTKQGNDRKARNIEAAHRAALANGLVGIRERKAAPMLKDFLKTDFLPFAETKHAGKAMTLRYYKQGCDMLTKSHLGALRLSELTNQHAQEFASKHSALSASGINRGLRTLRRACNLACEWGKLDRPVKVTLAAGEKQRDRVLTTAESDTYLEACPQPWKDCATIITEEGFRPGEVFALQWPHVFFEQSAIAIVEGKSRAARRVLPMTPRVQALLSARWESAGKPREGYVFPSTAKAGHFDQNVAKDQHAKALEDSKVARFVPYTLRHTALTRLGEKAGGDPFVLARIAGHSTITITQRYVHPQADAISRVFAAQLPKVGTKLGTTRKSSRKRTAELKEQKALKSA